MRSSSSVTTETGWDAPGAADERLQGVILVNTYLAQFKRGWRYTFINPTWFQATALPGRSRPAPFLPTWLNR